jgi:hypothetical protein
MLKKKANPKTDRRVQLGNPVQQVTATSPIPLLTIVYPLTSRKPTLGSALSGDNFIRAAGR